MLKLFKPSPGVVLGIDIGTSAINILQITHTDDSFCITGYERWAFPISMVKEDGGGKFNATHAIHKLLSSNTLAARSVVLAIPDVLTLQKTLYVHPSLKPHEVQELVAMESRKYITDPSQIFYDFYTLGPAPHDPSLHEIVFVVTRAENVLQRVGLVTKRQLTVKAVEKESHAIERVCSRLMAESNNMVIFDVNIHKMYFYVLNKNTIVYSQEKNTDQELLDNFSQQHGVDKRDLVLMLTEYPMLYEDFLTQLHDFILLQLNHLLQLYFAVAHDRSFHKLWLAGDLARVPYLVQKSEQFFQIPTSILNPLKALQVANHLDREKLMQDAPMLLIACGLALRAC